MGDGLVWEIQSRNGSMEGKPDEETRTGSNDKRGIIRYGNTIAPILAKFDVHSLVPFIEFAY